MSTRGEASSSPATELSARGNVTKSRPSNSRWVALSVQFPRDAGFIHGYADSEIPTWIGRTPCNLGSGVFHRQGGAQRIRGLRSCAGGARSRRLGTRSAALGVSISGCHGGSGSSLCLCSWRSRARVCRRIDSSVDAATRLDDGSCSADRLSHTAEYLALSPGPCSTSLRRGCIALGSLGRSCGLECGACLGSLAFVAHSRARTGNHLVLCSKCGTSRRQCDAAEPAVVGTSRFSDIRSRATRAVAVHSNLECRSRHTGPENRPLCGRGSRRLLGPRGYGIDVGV